jgi:hypothetical protein
MLPGLTTAVPVTSIPAMKFFAALLIAHSMAALALAEEPDDSRIIDQVLQTRAAILKSTSNTMKRRMKSS